ncbi:unnamed protein product [Meganyctiphanes norvegica]|uniref:MULE transposase domain-containing protein n=1 Tax=Meganyctiphanes norvegica TaxID=48144 RepID=A0AAV2Q3Q9_MEGNR
MKSTLNLPTGQELNVAHSFPPPSIILNQVTVFYIGQHFTSYEEICAAKEIYEEQCKINIIKKDSRRISTDTKRNNEIILNANQALIYSELLYICMHGGAYKGKRKRKATEYDEASETNTNNVKKIRKTSTAKLQCPFKLHLSLSPDGQTLKVLKLKEEHNHICHSSIYDNLPKQRRLVGETLDETKRLLTLNVDKKKIQQHLHSKGKMVTIQDLHNLMRDKVKRSHSLDDVLNLIEQHHSLSHEILRSNEDICQGIYFQTDAMKLMFDANSEILFFDHTYKLNELGMTLYVILCLDGNGKRVVISIALVQCENEKTVPWIAESFIKYNPGFIKVKHIMADKDMLDRQELLNHFPNAQLLICFFQTLQAFKREISATKMDISAEERDFSLEIIQDIFFAKDKTTCDFNITLLKETAPSMVVEYFTNIWESIKDDWIIYLEKQSFKFYQPINSLVEMFNGKLESLKKCSSAIIFVTDLLTVIQEYDEECND